MVKKGFSIVDMVVSIGILIVITGAVVANFRAGQRNDSVRQAVNIAESLLRKAQTMSASGALMENGSFPQGGYGVRFGIDDYNTIVLFADLNGNRVYDSGEEIDLEPLPGSAFFLLDENLDVVFPQALSSAYFNGAENPYFISIEFSAENTDITKNLIIYRVSGQIRVE